MTKLEMLVTLLDDRGGPLTLRDGAVVERSTGHTLTVTEYTEMVETALAELAELAEYYEDSDTTPAHPSSAPPPLAAVRS